MREALRGHRWVSGDQRSIGHLSRVSGQFSPAWRRLAGWLGPYNPLNGRADEDAAADVTVIQMKWEGLSFFVLEEVTTFKDT